LLRAKHHDPQTHKAGPGRRKNPRPGPQNNVLRKEALHIQFPRVWGSEAAEVQPTQTPPPTLSPILTPLMDAMGTISAPVPVRKASPHVRGSTGVMSLYLIPIGGSDNTFETTFRQAFVANSRL
jgi:hypothetical protein